METKSTKKNKKMHEQAIKILETEISKMKADEQYNNIKIHQIETLQHSLNYLKFHSEGELKGLVDKVKEWGKEKGIIGENAKATITTQYQKLLEEVLETGEAIENKDKAEIADGIGDMTVVNILLADLAGLDFIQCLQLAYGVISKRTGKMVDGVFIKDK